MNLSHQPPVQGFRWELFEGVARVPFRIAQIGNKSDCNQSQTSLVEIYEITLYTVDIHNYRILVSSLNVSETTINIVSLWEWFVNKSSKFIIFQNSNMIFWCSLPVRKGESREVLRATLTLPKEGDLLDSFYYTYFLSWLVRHFLYHIICWFFSHLLLYF